MSGDIWLKMGQAMRKANVCRDTMRKWCLEGVVKAKLVPAGNRMDWRISAESIDSLGGDVSTMALEHLRRIGL